MERCDYCFGRDDVFAAIVTKADVTLSDGMAWDSMYRPMIGDRLDIRAGRTETDEIKTKIGGCVPSPGFQVNFFCDQPHAVSTA